MNFIWGFKRCNVTEEKGIGKANRSVFVAQPAGDGRKVKGCLESLERRGVGQVISVDVLADDAILHTNLAIFEKLST